MGLYGSQKNNAHYKPRALENAYFNTQMEVQITARETLRLVSIGFSLNILFSMYSYSKILTLHFKLSGV